MINVTDSTSAGYVAYYRVSTQRQGQSGLGLEAQQVLTRPYADQIVDAYTEIESGRKNDRPQLQKALERCRETGATLLVGKLDRLSRSVFFTSRIMESGVAFKCADMPEANRLTLQLMSVLAEHEARTIAERTRAALVAKRSRGETLGNVNNLTAEGRRQGAEAMRKRAADAYAVILPLIQQLKESGNTLAVIAERLNETGQRNSRGNRFSAKQVSRILNRV